jgi:hypothetical protein
VDELTHIGSQIRKPSHAHLPPSYCVSDWGTELGVASAFSWRYNLIRGQGKVKVKVKLSLCFFYWAPRHEVVLGEWKYSSTHSLTSALHEGEWSASRPGRFIPRERAPGTHWIGGCVGPRAVLDAVVKRIILSPRRISNLRTPIVQPLA